MSKDKQKNTLQKQQWAKYISTHIAVNLAMRNPESPLKQSYDNTYHCNRVKTYDGKKITGTYCKNRWCMTCNRIRTAVNILNYGPQISEFGQPYFVTLTRPTCTIDELGEQIKAMDNAWRRLYNYGKDKRKEPFKKGIRLKGIRKMECTLRPGGKYHYHFHLLVDGWANAEWICSEWLKRNPDSSEKAQDVRPADKRSLIEVMKYVTKLSAKAGEKMDYKRLDKLFLALKGKRMLAPFGGLRVPKKDAEEEFEVESQYQEELKLRFGNEKSVWVWEKEAEDWINKSTGEFLIGKEIPDRILQKGD